VPLRVLGPRVLLRPIHQERSSLIALTDREPPTVGEVVGLGTNRCAACDATLPADLALGDVVLIPAIAGQEITVNGEAFWIVPSSAVLSFWKSEDVNA